MVIVPRRGSEVGSPAGRLGSELERDVEVLRPELDERGIAVWLVRPQLLEHRAGQAVEVSEGARRTSIDLGRERLPALLVARWRTSSPCSTRTWQSTPSCS